MRDLRKKAAQLIVPRLEGNRLLEEEYLQNIIALVDSGIGGFILFGGKFPDTPDAISRLQGRANIPLLITSDIEQGIGQQLTGGTRFPNQWAVSEAIDLNNPNDTILLHAMLAAVRDECIEAGIHVVFSPVADVNVNPDNPIICTRSFGEDPDKVSRFVTEYVKGLQPPPQSSPSQGGVKRGSIACAKHFPGHGDTAVDSHTSLPLITADIKRLEGVELPPFKAAIKAGVGMIMIGHLKVPALDPEPIPATFSRKIVTNLLKKQMGFNGLVVTDALDMGALKSICDEDEAAVRCLLAGCDVLLHPSKPLKVLDSIVRAVEDGRVPYERVDEAFSKIIKAKDLIFAECGMQNAGFNSGSRTPNSELAGKIARKAIKFRKGTGVSSYKNIVCLVVDDDGDGSVATTFLDALKDRVPSVETHNYASLQKSTMEGQTIIIPIFSRVSAWKGSSGLSKVSIQKIKDAIDRAGQSVLISFGSPYILNSFDADVMMDAFDFADSMQEAAVERLIQC